MSKGEKRGVIGDDVYRLIQEFLPLFHKHLLPAFRPDLKSKLGLSKSQERALLIIRNAGPATATDIGACLGMTKANLTLLIDELEHGGLVRRSQVPGDRRKAFVEITERGRELAELIAREIQSGLAQRLSSLSDTEARRLAGGLKDVVIALRTIEE